MHLVLGFLIALAVGLTGIGGGSFTVPALLLIVGLPAGEAVGTAFVFAGVLRLIAAPFYLLRRHVHSRYFRLMLIGADSRPRARNHRAAFARAHRQQSGRRHHPRPSADVHVQPQLRPASAKSEISS